MEFEHSFVVAPDDIDQQGHVNNVAYLRWVQEAAVAHWRHSATAEQQAALTWVVLRHEVDYLQPSFAGETITAATWVGKASAVKCERFTTIRRGDKVLVKAFSLWCLIGLQTGKPHRINAELRERFGMA